MTMCLSYLEFRTMHVHTNETPLYINVIVSLHCEGIFFNHTQLQSYSLVDIYLENIMSYV